MTAGVGKGRAKGKRGELEVVRLLNGWGWETRRTGVAGQIEGDIANEQGWYLEVKLRDRFSIWDVCAHSDELAKALSRPSAVIFRRTDRKCPWRVVLELDADVAKMMEVLPKMWDDPLTAVRMLCDHLNVPYEDVYSG